MSRFLLAVVLAVLSAAALAQRTKLVDVGSGCKAHMAEPKPGERYSWIGPCKDGLTEGLGYSTLESGASRTIWRQTHEAGYLLKDGPGYSNFNGMQRTNSNKWEPTTTGEMPTWARTFVVDNKRPAMPKQPEEVASTPLATSSGDCNVSLTPEQQQYFRPKGDELLIWIGPCANGLAHGRGVVFQRRKDPQNGVTYRHAVRYFAREGSLQHAFRPIYISEASGTVWIDAEGAKETARVKRAEVPAWASYVLGKSNLTSKDVEAAREVLSKELQERAPRPDEIVEAGECKLAFKPSPQTKEYRWRGPCDASGFAHGPGYLEMYRHNGGRAINKVSVVMGRMLQGTEPYQITPQRQIMHLSSGQWHPVVTDQAPAWAREFLLGATFPAAAPTQQAAPATHAQSAVDAAAAEREREEIRAQIERRRREDEEDDRRTRREAEDEREARNRQWTDMATSIVAGAAAMKRQQDEQNARREAERRRIEADNARYRQARADEDRRSLEQNQRQQQAAVERQRVEQERQRVEEARREEERRRPRKERVNLPKYTGCIRLEWGKNIPQNNDQWYTLHNTCAQELEVHWCDRPGCQRSTGAASIPGGGSTRSWVLKKNGVSVTVTAACQKNNGGETVYYNASDNQCWSMVTMR